MTTSCTALYWLNWIWRQRFEIQVNRFYNSWGQWLSTRTAVHTGMPHVWNAVKSESILSGHQRECPIRIPGRSQLVFEPPAFRGQLRTGRDHTASNRSVTVRLWPESTRKLFWAVSEQRSNRISGQRGSFFNFPYKTPVLRPPCFYSVCARIAAF